MADIEEFGSLGGKHCDDLGDHGTCTFCGPDVTHTATVEVWPRCVQCGGLAEMRDDQYCEKWPRCRPRGDGGGRGSGMPRMGQTVEDAHQLVDGWMGAFDVGRVDALREGVDAMRAAFDRNLLTTEETRAGFDLFVTTAADPNTIAFLTVEAIRDAWARIQQMPVPREVRISPGMFRESTYWSQADLADPVDPVDPVDPNATPTELTGVIGRGIFGVDVRVVEDFSFDEIVEPSIVVSPFPIQSPIDQLTVAERLRDLGFWAIRFPQRTGDLDAGIIGHVDNC